MHELIVRYVVADASLDANVLVARFADDAVVIDEGQSWRRTREIRAWRDISYPCGFMVSPLSVDEAAERPFDPGPPSAARSQLNGWRRKPSTSRSLRGTMDRCQCSR
jgi:hypothetical protein